MYIVEVSPLKSIKGFKSLSYFSSHKFNDLDIIEVPFRNANIPAIVLSVKEVRSVKADVKDKNFAPKKIRKQEPIQLADKDFMRAAKKYSEDHLFELGPVLNQIIPAAALKYAKDLKLSQQKTQLETSYQDKISTLLVNDFSDARLDSFKALVRQKLAQEQSVLLMSTNNKNAKKIYDFLSPGISSMLKHLDSTLSPKNLYQEIERINSSKDPVCVVGTAATLFLQPPKLGLIIVEKESSIAYLRRKSPRINIRDFAKFLAKEKNIDIVFADSFLKLENYMLLFKEEAASVGHVPKRLRKRVRLRLIDLQKEIKYNKEYKLNYPVISREILGEIERYSKENKKIFIFNPKKHVANQIVCNDCAHVLSCPKCKATLKLQEDPKTKERHIICLRCGFAVHSNISCPKCGSWRLMELGVGIDKVADFLRKRFPSLSIYLFDSDKIKTEKEAKRILDEFYNLSAGSVLIGTQKALSFLDQNSVHYSVALSIDSLLSIADFQMEERIFSILVDIMDKSIEAMDIQAKNIKERSVKLFADKDLQKFVKGELKLREKLLWPPFTRLIKVSVSGSRKEVIDKMQVFINQFSKYKPRVFRDFVYTDKKSVELSAIIRIPRQLWPREVKDLWSDLYDLPADFKVEIDPVD